MSECFLFRTETYFLEIALKASTSLVDPYSHTSVQVHLHVDKKSVT